MISETEAVRGDSKKIMARTVRLIYVILEKKETWSKTGKILMIYYIMQSECMIRNQTMEMTPATNSDQRSMIIHCVRQNKTASNITLEI